MFHLTLPHRTNPCTAWHFQRQPCGGLRQQRTVWHVLSCPGVVGVPHNGTPDAVHSGWRSPKVEGGGGSDGGGALQGTNGQQINTATPAVLASCVEALTVVDYLVRSR